MEWLRLSDSISPNGCRQPHNLWLPTTRMCFLPTLHVACTLERHHGGSLWSLGSRLRSFSSMAGWRHARGKALEGLPWTVEGCSPEVACIIHNSRSRTCRLAPPNLWGSESSVMSKQTGTAVVPDWIWGMKEDSQVSDLESEVDIWGIHWEREDGISQGKADRPNNYKSFSAWKYNHFIGSFLLSREELEINCLLARVYSLQRMC